MSAPFDSAFIGVNFSNTFQSNPISPQAAINQIAAAGLKVVKMFNDTQTDVFDLASSTGLSVLMDVPNDQLGPLVNGDTAAVVNAVSKYRDIVPMVCVGNEPYLKYQGRFVNITISPDQLPAAVSNLQSALKSAGLDVKVTVPFNAAVLSASYPPSSGAFASDISPYLSQICKTLADNESVFMVNIYPWYARIGDPIHVSLDYCLFTCSQPPVHDPVWNLNYQNIFDASYDAVWAALDRIGHGTLPIVVGECGWPGWDNPPAPYTDGTKANAQTFVQNLVTHCKSGKGTPRNPGKDLTCFVFEMYDEDTKNIDPGVFERHWGVYDSSGQPKLRINW